jgi:hypothetical protein
MGVNAKPTYVLDLVSCEGGRNGEGSNDLVFLSLQVDWVDLDFENVVLGLFCQGVIVSS